MTTGPTRQPMPVATATRVPLRLDVSASPVGEPVDGTWWPQSRDLDVELRDLVDHFPEGHGTVNRAIFSRPDWDSAPRRVQVTRGLLHVGSFPSSDNHQIWLLMSTRTLMRFAVRPADADGVDAADAELEVTPAS